MKNILVIGGAGYIGSHVVKMLKTQGYKPVVYDNLSTGFKESIDKKTPFVKGDLADKTLLKKVFRKYKIDAVMHFAAFTQVGESVKNPAKYYQNNLAKVLNLLDSMIENHIKYFVFSSTAATFGNPITKTISETHPQNPINPYGQSKLFVEKVLKDYDFAYGLKSTVLRYFNASGADESAKIGEAHKNETHLIPLVLQTALGKRKEIKIFGTDYPTPDGTCIRDYVHVNDLANAHILALKYMLKNNKSEDFNLGSSKGASVLEIIKKVQKITGKNFKVVKDKRRPGDPAILIASSKKAKKILNWKTTYSVDKIIKTAYQWELKRKY